MYRRPYDAARPVVCLDETVKQLIGGTREPLPAKPAAVERYDHVYVRHGVANLFLACEPLAGWRHVAVTEHRRRTAWAEVVRVLLDGCYRDAPVWDREGGRPVSSPAVSSVLPLMPAQGRCGGSRRP